MSAPDHAFRAVRERIVHACEQAGRDPGSVRLLAVSKTRTADDIRALHALGQTAFGENYVQELIDKFDALETGPNPLGLEWHYIGALQSNKTRPVAERAHWVHTIDRERIARRLSEQRPEHLPPLQVCLQINVSGESQKAGVPPEAAAALADTVANLPGLTLRGLMTLPAAESNRERQRRPFARLRQLKDELNARGHGLDTLSMGMSGDLEAAILEGASLVRIGTALFGPRITPERNQ
ncbi:alanine racemase domain protein [Thioalkalivibrio sp. K90mix]|uniref:YggS family pyridoxal phosphate-dependent enzyme n=1 Tax=unclassified Thioalkalivibrio TaxID=2621013 RepID=UPI0001959422|nr:MULTISPECIES: YggS family pyridoxal phosphate-dependent enzyme [unclassified Thioalkalivibrio]ADC72905.1 alanine racemase domain protein [Thioalkalivibrio sp. K90mix]